MQGVTPSDAKTISIELHPGSKKRLWLLALVVLFVAAALWWWLSHPQSSFDKKQYEQQIAAQNRVIELARQQRTADSLTIVRLVRDVDTLRQHRAVLNQQIAHLQQTLNFFNSDYEKISTRYRDASADSVQKLFARRFGAAAPLAAPAQ